MFNKKDIYGKTFEKIKEYVEYGGTFKKLSPDDVFELMGVFLDECLSSYSSETFLDILLNDHVFNLLKHFFLTSQFNSTFKRDLFILVSQEYEMLFEELFDEAYEEINLREYSAEIYDLYPRKLAV